MLFIGFLLLLQILQRQFASLVHLKYLYCVLSMVTRFRRPWPMVLLRYVLRRRRLEKLRSADADVTGIIKNNLMRIITWLKRVFIILPRPTRWRVRHDTDVHELRCLWYIIFQEKSGAATKMREQSEQTYTSKSGTAKHIFWPHHF